MQKIVDDGFSAPLHQTSHSCQRAGMYPSKGNASKISGEASLSMMMMMMMIMMVMMMMTMWQLAFQADILAWNNERLHPVELNIQQA